jgi:hypothetical protein
MTETIDLTPTWESLVPVLVHILQHSETETAKRLITAEIMSMAKAADMWNAHCKSVQAAV